MGNNSIQKNIVFALGSILDIVRNGGVVAHELRASLKILLHTLAALPHSPQTMWRIHLLVSIVLLILTPTPSPALAVDAGDDAFSQLPGPDVALDFQTEPSEVDRHKWS